jgi:uncharacterized delta-60 repeat protein
MGARLASSAPSALLAMGIQFLSLTAIATAAPGDLDTSFGIDGIARARIATTSGYSFERIHDLVIQPDGKIVAVGMSTNVYRHSALARFNPDGTLDSTFGTGGKRLASTSSAHNEAHAVALQSDGKIVMAGYETDYVTNISSFAVARFNSNGSFDPDFSGDGMVSLPRRVYSANEKVVAIGIQPSGKILVAGVSPESGVYSAVARLNEDGTLDTSFRGAGKFSEYHREPKLNAGSPRWQVSARRCLPSGHRRDAPLGGPLQRERHFGD